MFRVAIQQYCVSLISVAIFALVVNALATNFGAQKDQTQAFKTAVYASTASWIAGGGGLLGLLGGLIGLAGLVYSIYLLHTSLPYTMKAPPERATGYTVVIAIVVIVVYIILGLVLGSVFGARAMFGVKHGRFALSPTRPGGFVVDKDTGAIFCPVLGRVVPPRRLHELAYLVDRRRPWL
jgi:hypothetical protein